MKVIHPLQNKGQVLLPTPRVAIPAQGQINYKYDNDPGSLLGSIDPNWANRPNQIRLYFEGADRPQKWMEYPELVYELMRLKPFQSKHRNGLQKRRSGYVWVHPSHQNGARGNTMYSGGSQYDASNNTLPARDTEWKVSTTSNSGKNPFTDVEIDPKLWFSIGVNNFGNNILPIRYLEYIDQNIRVAHGKGKNSVHGIQDFVFCFRMSCADPNSWNVSKGRYDNRLYSQFSEPFKIYPHGGLYENGGDGASGEYERILTEWRILPL